MVLVPPRPYVYPCSFFFLFRVFQALVVPQSPHRISFLRCPVILVGVLGCIPFSPGSPNGLERGWRGFGPSQLGSLSGGLVQ